MAFIIIIDGDAEPLIGQRGSEPPGSPEQEFLMGPGIKGSVNLDRKKRKEKKKYVLIFTNLCLEFNIPFNYRHRQQTKQGWQCLGLVTHRHHRCVYITLLFLGGCFEIST